jgi:WD40 repeat protein
MRKYKCEVLNCFMADRGFKKPQDLKLHTQKYHPPPKIPTLTLNTPPHEPKSESDSSSLLDNLSQDVANLRIDYAPETEKRFTVELLHQFTTTSYCCTTAISSDERYFAVGADKCISICSMATGKFIKSFHLDTDFEGDNFVRGVVFTPDSRGIVAASESRQINVSLSEPSCSGIV